MTGQNAMNEPTNPSEPPLAVAPPLPPVEPLPAEPPSAELPPPSPSHQLPLDQPPIGRRGMGVLELLLVSIGLALLMAGEIAINKPKMMFDGPYILDECLTDSIVRDPSLANSIHAVQHGVDTNPPVYHLILRGFWMGVHQLFPNCSPRIGLRVFSMICTWLALVGVYALLRKGFARPVALVGALAVWAHPVVIAQSGTARFYGPLLLASVAMCLTLQIRGSGILRGVVVALCAMALCTLHYFGILILGPIVLAMLLIDDAPMLGRILRVLPTIAGPLALLPFLPFIRTQHQGITVKTWVDPFSFHGARDFAMDVLCALPLLIAVVVWAIGRLMQRTTVSPAPVDARGRRAASFPMLSLILVPLVIIAFSAVRQSALIPRYAIAAALVLAPLVALLAENRSGVLLFFMAVLLSGLTVLDLHGVSATHAGDLRILTDRRNEMESEQPPLPMVFADRADATTLRAFAPDLLPRISILDQREPGFVLGDFRTYEIEMVGKVAPYYPIAPLITPAQLAGMGRFHLVGIPSDMQTILLEVPMRYVGGDVYEAVK
jgi:hypothetical protein